MKNSICITPFDAEMEISIKAVYLLNEFKAKGFETRRAFLEVVSENKPQYSSRSGFNQLTSFWHSRIKSFELNSDVEAVLEILKSE